MGKKRITAYKAVTDFVIQGLKEGHTPWKCPFFSTSFGNPLTGNRYTRSNPFMLALYNAIYGYSSNEFVTTKSVYQLWNRKGSFLKTSKQSCPVVYASKFVVKKDKDGNKLPKEDWEEHFTLKWYNVVNVEQLTDEAKELVQEKSKFKNEHLENKELKKPKELWDNWTDKPNTIVHELSEAWYSPSMDIIKVPSLNNHKTAEEYYSTLFHEGIHATGHQKRWDKKDGKNARFVTTAFFGDKNYTYEELVAEIGSAILCQMTGIENTIENSKNYLVGWAKKLEDNEKWILKAAKDALKAVEIIQNK